AMIDAYVQPLAAFSTRPDLPLAAGPVAYPPLFAWLVVPFTLPSPPTGFALWTALNVAGALWISWRIYQIVAPRHRIWSVLLLLTSLPMFQSLYIGHPMPLLAAALGEAFLALRAGHDMRAGLLIACLLAKPQYVVLIGPYLLWKRRWQAVAGLTIGGLVVLGGSVLVADPATLLAYPDAVRGMASFRDTGGNTQPEAMLNWRAVVLAAVPRISEVRGIALTLGLSVATIGVAAVALRGSWEPRGPRFAAGMALLVIATLVANYHSHVYGAVLLAVPLAAALADQRLTVWPRAAVVSMAFAWSCWTSAQLVWPTALRTNWPLPAVLLLLSFCAVTAVLWPTLPVGQLARIAAPAWRPRLQRFAARHNPISTDSA
ncbi:MAG: DUF2029 domain-containing protein, partial [Gemmatimonadaceae bacterium]|nr:DUF2029 domain-containing protein [Gemmatimonadaceae bacterium]